MRLTPPLSPDASRRPVSTWRGVPPYRVPSLRNLALGLWERARIFLGRVGTIIFSLTVILWFLSSYPAPPEGFAGTAIQYSAAGRIGQVLQHVFAPQCLSTLAVVRRETNSWRYPLLMAAYLFGLAYLASFVTWRVALALGAG